MSKLFYLLNPIFFVFLLLGVVVFSCRRPPQLKQEAREELVSKVSCWFNATKHYRYVCCAYRYDYFPDSNIYKLVIAEDSSNGEVVYMKSFDGDTDLVIDHFDVGNRNFGKYLLVHITSPSGKGLGLVVVAQKGDSIQEMGKFWYGRGLEFADINNDGVNEIIISNVRYLPEAYKTGNAKHVVESNIYAWEGEDLKLLCTLPWKQRLCVK